MGLNAQRQVGLRSPPVAPTPREEKVLRGKGVGPSGLSRRVIAGGAAADPRNGSGYGDVTARSRCQRKPTAVQSGNRHAALLGERRRESAGNRLCGVSRKACSMLSGPRRAQAGSHLPKNRPDIRTGPCGDVASHFVGLLVFMGEGSNV